MTNQFDPGHDRPFLRFLAPVLQEWRDGYVRTVLPLRGDLLNRSGVVHGGVLATMLDHACGLAGVYCAVPGNRRYAVTLSLNTSFIAQSDEGALTVIGERKSSGRKIYFSDAEIRTAGGVLVASGSGVFRYRGGSESAEGVPA
jgi:uncharacterized protein (TIGR00369 family)